jgi:nucleoside-diphosphate-sugar epimerase
MNAKLGILCLGAGGFIGSHLAERLLHDGHSVTGLDTHDDKLAADMSNSSVPTSGLTTSTSTRPCAGTTWSST